MPAIAKPGQTEPDQPPDGTETNKEGSGLYEFSYTSQSGWMYSVKGIFPGVGMSAYELQDGDVLRVQFTIHGIGADLGDKYDSNSYSLKLPDREDITKRLALINQNKEACFELGGCADAYQKACNAVVDLDTSEEKMIEVYQALPSENSIAIYIEKYNSNKASLVVSQINALGSVSLSNESQIVAARKAYNALTTEQKALVSADILSKLTQAEQNLSQLKAQTAAEQAAAEQKAQQKALQQALIKQNTPANTTLKSVKKTGTKKAKLTWKKVKDASGYEIYMSTKKSSGYKKIKTIKKAKTVTFTKSGLKKKKTYYFKVRTYRTVNGVTYYGSYSNVKQVKIK